MSYENALDGLPPAQSRALAYERARSMAESIIRKCPDTPLLQQYAHDMESCGLLILLRHFVDTGEIQARSANSCRHRVVCPLCAVRAARRNAGQLSAKLAPLTPYRFQLVTITQPDLPDYREAVDAMVLAHQRFMKAWRNGRNRLTMETFFNHYIGGYYSIEVKQGKGSGMAHPHIHYLMHGHAETTSDFVLRGNRPEHHPLSIELAQRNPLAGYICDVRDVVASDQGELAHALMEVCKYVHDFKCQVGEVWKIQEAIYRRRMSGSFGSLRGLKLDNNPDDVISKNEARMFVEHVLTWSDGQYTMENGCLASFDDLVLGADYGR